METDKDRIKALEAERDEAIEKYHAEIRRGRLACNEILDMELKAQREKYEADRDALAATLEKYQEKYGRID